MKPKSVFQPNETLTLWKCSRCEVYFPEKPSCKLLTQKGTLVPTGCHFGYSGDSGDDQTIQPLWVKVVETEFSPETVRKEIANAITQADGMALPDRFLKGVMTKWVVRMIDLFRLIWEGEEERF